jgi:hypothetical protein
MRGALHHCTKVGGLAAVMKPLRRYSAVLNVAPAIQTRMAWRGLVKETWTVHDRIGSSQPGWQCDKAEVGTTATWFSGARGTRVE